MLLTLAEFLDSLVHGMVLLALSVALGGVVWEHWVLGHASPAVPAAARRRCRGLTAAGAGLMAASQFAAIALKAWVLRASLGDVALSEIATSTYLRAAAARALLALALAAVALRAWNRESTRASAAALGLAGLIAMAGGWQTHAAGRLEAGGPLMVFTILHQVAAAVWLGGLVQLGALWPLAARDAGVTVLWPVAVRRLSRLAMIAVAALAAAAVPLIRTYAGSASALVGTGYGSLVLLKTLLLLATLVLALPNLVAARRASPGDGTVWGSCIPQRVEAEAMLLVLLVFAATGLSSLPPPADQPSDQRATAAEVIEVFRPKLPRLDTPSLEAMRRSDAAMEAGAPRTREAYLWSNFSHNAAGAILLAMSLVALAGPLFGARWSRHWPLGLLALSAFVYLRASAGDGTWPFGSMPIVEIDAEGLQHRLAALLVLAMGLLEWRARSARPGSPLTYVFPLLCVGGAVLLLMHAHSTFEPKEGYLVQLTHSSMGALAGLVAVGRWLEIRLAPDRGRLAGILTGLSMVGIALILLFYREANAVILAG